ncbi:hypothetical protein NCZ17_00800 [Acinetobacter modestus]|uniref:hypothetical protein n=1 Tax=Acinetobacter modestus TaxID=1776740 RepID=UPI00202E85CA|nr:hypothetical protein [Acinetobacter modestus]MCM1957909.1 hypothetical protein [Acinetobacter modestus]
MCGSRPKVVQQNPEADAAAAAAKATAETNVEKAKRRAFNQNSMLGSAQDKKSVLGGGG